MQKKFDGEQVTLEDYRRGVLQPEEHSAPYDAILKKRNTAIYE